MRREDIVIFIVLFFLILFGVLMITFVFTSKLSDPDIVIKKEYQQFLLEKGQYAHCMEVIKDSSFCQRYPQ